MVPSIFPVILYFVNTSSAGKSGADGVKVRINIANIKGTWAPLVDSAPKLIN